MKIVETEKWSYTLYCNDQSYYLAVVCGSVGIYEIVIELKVDEIEKMKDEGFIAKLASLVRSHPEAYSERSIKGFSTDLKATP
ncbi:hypothetical protein A9Q82_01550 [Cycloclasticus sp. 46_120_T64]|nr:hypothetical protein A9Q82_01550 [Cycloclasticus sp. 46_120_T64]